MAMKEGKSVTRIVRPLRGGQITIPAAFREELGITGDSLLQVTLAGGELRIKPVQATETAAGSPWLKKLYRRFAPVREEAGRYGEEEVNAVIDRAIEAVRERRA